MTKTSTSITLPDDLKDLVTKDHWDIILEKSKENKVITSMPYGDLVISVKDARDLIGIISRAEIVTGYGHENRRIKPLKHTNLGSCIITHNDYLMYKMRQLLLPNEN